MNKKDARNIAVDYLFNAAGAFTDTSVKVPIDDKGTLSDFGYSYEDCDKIEEQLNYLIKKILKYKL